MFDSFFKDKKEDFPSIKNILFSWVFIETIFDFIKKNRLELIKY
jgi:hypothetical protein